VLLGVVVLVVVLARNKGRLGGGKTGDIVLAPSKTCPLEVPEKDTGTLVLPDGGNTFGLLRKTEAIPRKWSFEPYELAAGRRIGRIDLTGVDDPKAVSLSPDGKQLLVMEVRGLGWAGDQWLWLWSLADGRRVTQDKWIPFPRDEKRAAFDAPAMYRAEFAANDRIVTLGTNRAIYSYHLPDFEVSTGAIPSNDREALGKHWGAPPENAQRYPWQAAFSADRKKMAVWTGDAYEIVSTIDGVRIVRTPSVRQLALDMWRGAPALDRVRGGPVAFSPDGNTLAGVLSHDFGGKKHALCFWDTREEREPTVYPIPENQYYDAPGLAWWGNKFVVTYGSRVEGMLIDVRTGLPRRQLMGPTYGRYGFSRDGKLWYAAGEERTKPATLYVVGGLDPEKLTEADDYEQIVELSQEFYLKRLWLEPGGVLRQPTREDPPLKQRLIRRP
jgi:WD40 repeat protein